MAAGGDGGGAQALAAGMWAALGGEADLLDRLGFVGEGALPSAFAVSDLAAASIGVAALAVAGLVGDVEGMAPAVTVDRRLASFWLLRPVGWTMPPAWDPIAGDYRCADGWIRLHTNAARHRAAALQALGVAEERAAVERAVAAWAGDALETAVVQAGGCAAVMRSLAAWRAHPQGRAVAVEPLVITELRAPPPFPDWRPVAERPLAGLKVLDLTRVLAGPVATRFIAGYGAEVLRIDPPEWEEPGVVPEVTLGKRCARLDLTSPADRIAFENLLANADVLVHGYRPGALEGLGLGLDARRRIAPDLIEVTLDAYGWSGPWAGRRGFDSLVQMSAGVAEAGMRWKGVDRPVPLPVQALDHATGYLMAATAIQAIRARLAGRGASVSRLSLARVAALLTDLPAPDEPPFAPETASDLAPEVEITCWGEARRLLTPVRNSHPTPFWLKAASRLGIDEPSWSAASPSLPLPSV